ncbi:hypothetical protein GGS23DRAFT_610313 [Durotheca rogersii]|uniref:uncharacterized protein n=1 Tax=Durotheca rogersii TaxID=419775 RepID=UPI00221F6F70|nr:uncharacterized protein GGS23DRAFT_610313 [Durotheca rogersii]KAI5862612.1 hypothetical protein GGS23DRAFT_610313 [Durotheca rogersii]
MRLDGSIYGVLACLAGSAAAADDGTPSSNSIFTFSGFSTPAVYPVDGGTRQIQYHRLRPEIEALEVHAVSLKRHDNNLTIAVGAIPSGTSLKELNRILLERQTEPPSIPPSSSQPTFQVTNGALMLDTTSSRYTGYRFLNEPLYYEIQWGNLTVNGSSYSQLFVVATIDLHQQAISNLERLGTDPALPENVVSSSGDGNSTATGAAATAIPSASAATTNVASDSRAGLSIGAIVGIAVGCGVAGLLLIGFLVWFFAFRRRPRAPGRGGDDGGDDDDDDTGTRSIVREKEAAVATATTTAVTTMTDSSPRSAYADDGGRLHDPRRSVGGGGGGGPGIAVTTDDDDDGGDGYDGERGARQPSTYAPYSDRAASAASGGPSAPTPTPAFASRYGHLIEEGMTEDEIRRLEEEERQLDAAIEDAGRNSRLARSS